MEPHSLVCISIEKAFGSTNFAMVPQNRECAVKRWCFTIFNYTQQRYDELKTSLIPISEYVIIGKELCPSTNQPHLQGYVSFKRKCRFAQAKSRIDSQAHIEPAKGTPRQNFEYCSKSGDYWQSGEMPRYGRGSDIKSNNRKEASEAFIKSMDENNLEGFVSQYPHYYMFHGHNLMSNYYSLKSPIDRPDIKCFWIYGPTGVGKSKISHEILPNAYIKDHTKWWHMYRLQTDVILDDLTGTVPVSSLLNWFDRYKCTVETKGSCIPLYAKRVIITSNFSPSEMYILHAQALERRFKVYQALDNNDITTIKFDILTELALI